jgi:tetratricopeptide (TPR) repeat protein
MDRTDRLADLFETIESAADPGKTLLNYILDDARAKDPPLAEAIAYCAIPRRFNAEIIGVLRDDRADDRENHRLLEKLRTFNFVQPREDHTYAYHDEFRDLILKQWQTDEQRREDFERLNGRLADFYKHRQVQVRELQADLDRVSTLVRGANPSRYLQLTSLVEGRLLTPLLEVLYHVCLISPEAGYDTFTTYYQEFESREAYTICQSLLNAMRFYLERGYAAGKAKAWLRWLGYWEARLAQSLRQYDRAEKVLRDLLEDTGDDDKLRLWALSEYGNALESQHRLSQARDAFQEELSLAEKTQVDPFNLPTTLLRIGSLFLTLGEPKSAERELGRSLKEARNQKNDQVEHSALLALSGALDSSNKREAALDTAMQALRLARTRLATEPRAQKAVAWQFAMLLSTHDPLLLDTVIAEYRAHSEASGQLYESCEAAHQSAEMLRVGRQLSRSSAILKAMEGRLDDGVDPRLRASFLLGKALLLEDQGQVGEAIRAYDKILELPKETSGIAFSQIAALSNRGMLKAQHTDTRAGIADLEKAAEWWKSMGNERLAKVVRLSLARIYAEQRRWSRYRQAMAGVKETLVDATSVYLGEFHRVRGRAARERARWKSARSDFHRARHLFRAADQYRDTAEVLEDLAGVASSEGRWQDAADHAATASQLWRLLADRDRYRPTPAVEEADRINANGMRHFVTSSGDRAEMLSLARGAFQEASRLVPENPWYLLNLAYAHAGLQEWADAVSAIKKALDCKRGPLPQAGLYRLLDEYRFQQGENLIQNGRYREAEKVLSRNLEELGGRLAPDRSAEHLLKIGDCFLKLRLMRDATKQYKKGRDLPGRDPRDFLSARFHFRLGLLALFWGEIAEALEELGIALGLSEPSGGASRIEELIGDGAGLIETAEQQGAFDAVLRALSDPPDPDRSQLRHLRKARLQLSEARYRQTPDGARPAPGEPLVELANFEPIRLEMETGLVPENERETQEFGRRVKLGMTGHRRSITERTGVTVPAVRFLDNPALGPGGYVVSLRGVVRAVAKTVPAHRFCPDAEGCRRLGIAGEAVVMPDDGGLGIWIPEPDWDRVDGAGLPLWDSLEYIQAHLERLLLRHLDLFVGIQELKAMLDKWAAAAPAERRALVDRALPDDEARRRLHQVVIGLLKEQVPLTRLADLLSAFATPDAASLEVDEVTEDVRLALRGILPGQGPAAVLLGLAPGFEQAVASGVHAGGGKRFLVLPEDEWGQLLDAVRAGTAGLVESQVSLIVRNRGLRRFVRRLVEDHFPDLTVLAAAELLEPPRALEDRIPSPFSTAAVSPAAAVSH